MLKSKDVESSYTAYLESFLARQPGEELSQALRKAGLHPEGKALEEYFERSASASDSIQGSDWHGRRCFVGPRLPPQAMPGDVWFDTVEITPMLLLAFSEDRNRWVSLHPAYVWQFRTFLRLADFQQVEKYFMKAADLFDSRRFQSMNSMAFVTNVYHEEAVAYAHWFGKYLCGQFVLRLAKKSLNSEEFLKVLPPDMRLWDEAAFPLSEFVRIAVGQNNLYKNPDDEFDDLNDDVNKSLPDRILFDEWDRELDIGLSTMVASDVGLLSQIPRMAYEFIELKNAAPRP